MLMKKQSRDNETLLSSVIKYLLLGNASKALASTPTRAEILIFLFAIIFSAGMTYTIELLLLSSALVSLSGSGFGQELFQIPPIPKPLAASIGDSVRTREDLKILREIN
jgi:hypothetical protein